MVLRQSSVSSLRILPSRTMPQWPWLVYSSMQTSVISTKSGTSCLSRAKGTLHDPVRDRSRNCLVRLSAPEFRRESWPECPEPERRALPSPSRSIDKSRLPRHRSDRLATPLLLQSRNRIDEIARRQRRFTHHPPERFFLAQTAQALNRKGHVRSLPR